MRRRWSRRLALVVVPAVVSVSLAACDGGADPEPDPATPSQVRLSFGVFGTEPELAAYQEVVDDYNAEAESVEVELLTWPTSEAMTADLDSGTAQPDVYLLARRDLRRVVEEGRNEPLFELLAERNVSYGDSFAQPAINAFSADDDLQCMPASVSPMVIYYNTDLVDFEAMREQDLPAPDDELEGWTFEQFAAAAAFASRPRGEVRGVSITPTLASITPFLLSGGGSLFDSDDDPRALDLDSSTNLETLGTLLTVLRDQDLTLSEEQLAEASPQEWFERGELAMIEGFRDLTPELRRVDGLDFDVMPMPTIGGAATIGDVTGLCISPGDRVQQAADFLVHAISDEGVEPLARTGSIVPAVLSVARSDAFLQPTLQPEHAGVFNASVDNLVLLPLVDGVAELNAVVEPLLTELLLTPGTVDPAELAGQIDEVSRPVLDPDYDPDGTGSESDEPEPDDESS
ncbi:extracellular solute-binding protein [Nocardioides sp. C4-1]|uniref:extracellular solute-binding protein n=1 Tax=Nocardioides sp. C4-1 TaxID=3151851 RepID=UPI003265AF54